MPWIIAIGLFYYLFTEYPLERLMKAAPYIHLPFFISYAVVYFVYMWLMDCWSLARLFSRFGYRTSTRDLLTMRLATYPLMILNYGAAQGTLAYFFKNAKQMPFFKSTSLVAFTTVIDVYWTITLAVIGSWFSGLIIEGTNFTKPLWTIWLFSTVVLFGFTALLKMPFSSTKWNWIRSRHILFTFREVRFADFLHAMAVRLPLHIALTSSLYFVALTFGVRIPFFAVITHMPIVVLIASLPISPGGLGTFQVATVELFKGWISGNIIKLGIVSPKELLFLMSLAAQMTNYILKIVTGIYFFRRDLIRSLILPPMEKEVKG